MPPLDLQTSPVLSQAHSMPPCLLPPCPSYSYMRCYAQSYKDALPCLLSRFPIAPFPAISPKGVLAREACVAVGGMIAHSCHWYSEQGPALPLDRGKDTGRPQWSHNINSESSKKKELCYFNQRQKSLKMPTHCAHIRPWPPNADCQYVWDLRVLREPEKLKTAHWFYNSSLFILAALFTRPDREKKDFAAINIHSSYIPTSRQHTILQSRKTKQRTDSTPPKQSWFYLFDFYLEVILPQ